MTSDWLSLNPLLIIFDLPFLIFLVFLLILTLNKLIKSYRGGRICYGTHLNCVQVGLVASFKLLKSHKVIGKKSENCWRIFYTSLFYVYFNYTLSAWRHFNTITFTPSNITIYIEMSDVLDVLWALHGDIFDLNLITPLAMTICGLMD